MADEYQVSITIKGDSKDAERAFANLSRSMKQATDDSHNAGRASQNLSMDMFNLQGAVAGAITAFGVSGVINMTTEMVNIGREVERADAMFRQLAGGQDEAADLMRELEAATSGAVDQMTIMQGANRLMAMGLATSTEETSRLMEMAVKLGMAFGNDATSSIENFAAMLANQSIERLDSFGISSGRVRQRIDELLASGQALNREDAFRMAVLEEGANSLENLGTAIDQGITDLDRLEVRAQNAVNNISTFFSRGAAGWATAIESAFVMADYFAEQNQIAADEIAATAAQEIAAMETWQGIRDQLNSEIAPTLGREFSDEFVQAAVAAIQEQGFGASLEDVAEAMGPQGISVFAPADEDEYYDTLDALSFIMREYQQATSEAAAAEQAAAVNQAELNREYERANAMLERGNRIIEEREAALRAEQQLSFDMNQRNIMVAVNEGGGIFGGQRGSVGGPLDSTRLFALEEVQSMQAALQVATDQLDMLRFKAEQYPGFIDDAELESLEGYVDGLKGMVAEAERGYQAFDRLDDSLSNLFGQGSGGALGQIGDELSAFLSDQGTDESALEALNQTFALGSGRETELSQQFESEVLPTLAAIYEQYGADAALSAAQAYQDGVMAAWQSGDFSFDPASLLGFEMGVDKFGNETLLPTGGGPTIPGVIGGAPVEGGRSFAGWFGGGEEGAAPEEMMPDMTPLQTQMSEIQTSGEAFSAALVAAGEPAGKLAGTSAAFAANLGVAETSTLSIEKHLHDLAANTQTVTVKLDVDTTNVPTELKMLFRGLVEDVVRENGGLVPGAEGSGVKP